MSRKHFETVATCIRVQTFETPGLDADRATAHAIASALALEFALDNPRFDRERFLAACGF